MLFRLLPNAGRHVLPDGEMMRSGDEVQSEERMDLKFVNKFLWVDEPLEQKLDENGVPLPPPRSFVHKPLADNTPPIDPAKTVEDELKQQIADQKVASQAAPKLDDEEEEEEGWKPTKTEQVVPGIDVTEKFLHAEAKGFRVFDLGDEQFHISKPETVGLMETKKPLSRAEAKKFIKEAAGS